MEDEIVYLANQIQLLDLKKQPVLLTTSQLRSVTLQIKRLQEQAASTILVRQNSTFRNPIFCDLHLLRTNFALAKWLKLYEDSPAVGDHLDLSLFANLKIIELWKVDANKIRGLQALRAQIEKLGAYQTTNSLGDLLARCGGDDSDSFCWGSLKEFTFTKNSLGEFKPNLIDCVHWLKTLDLSYNSIKTLPVIDLPLLKYFNLSFNKLESVPNFKRETCLSLQTLVLRNNFIEDLTELQHLIGLNTLDLSNNCLVDHSTLTPLSSLEDLKWLSLANNPLSFHPLHRIKTAELLNHSLKDANLTLNNAPLTQIEKKHISALFPTHLKPKTQRDLGEGSDFSRSARSGISIMSNSAERMTRVREVVIEEDDTPQATPSTSLSRRSVAHLEKKREIEVLREVYGNQWLREAFKDNLSAVSQPIVASSPYQDEFLRHSDVIHQPAGEDEPKLEVSQANEDSFTTAFEKTFELVRKAESVESECSSVGDLDLEGEENIYLANDDDSEPILLIITKSHFVEKSGANSKEKTRWHINSVVSCEVLEGGSVQVDFDTMRKEKKQRIYKFNEDGEVFIRNIRKIMEERAPIVCNFNYTCVKCSTLFTIDPTRVRIGGPVIQCPSCDSTLVVEQH